MRSATALTCVLALALAVSAVQAQNVTSVKALLESRNYKLAAALVEAANMTKVLSSPNARYTVFIPNDNAVQEFLTKMGLTPADLAARPGLARRLVAQHIILRSNLRHVDIFNGTNVRVVPTLAGAPNDVLYRKLDNSTFKVTDVQGNTANAKAAIAVDDNKSIHPIDKVLLPDTVFFSFPDLCRVRRLTIRDFCNALVYADLNATLASPDFNATVFVPNNNAFYKFETSLKGQSPPAPAAVADLLKYHVVAGPRELPKGFKNGVPVPTLLANQSISVTYETAKPKAGSSRKSPHAVASVRTTSGQTVQIIRSNVYVGKAIAQGIGAVLKPGTQALPAAPTSARGRRLMLSMSSGRRLLGWGWGFDGGPTAEEDAASQAIENAADGDESTADAAAQSLRGAEELSVPGAYDQVDEGINPW